MPKEPVIKTAAAVKGQRTASKRKPKRDPARAIGGGGKRVQPRGTRRSGR